MKPNLGVHVHEAKHRGEFWLVCECGATMPGPKSKSKDRAWHTCRLCTPRFYEEKNELSDIPGKTA